MSFLVPKQQPNFTFFSGNLFLRFVDDFFDTKQVPKLDIEMLLSISCWSRHSVFLYPRIYALDERILCWVVIEILWSFNFFRKKN